MTQPARRPTRGLIVDLTAEPADDIAHVHGTQPPPANSSGKPSAAPPGGPGDCEEGTLNEVAGNPITGKHVRILLKGLWLDDEIINSYLHILATEYPAVGVLSTFFHTKLAREGLSDALRRWLRPLEPVARLELVLIPVNLNNTHWALLGYSVPARTLSYYDSMLDRRAGRALLEAGRPVFEYLHSPAAAGAAATSTPSTATGARAQARTRSKEPVGLLAFMLSKVGLDAPGPANSARPSSSPPPASPMPVGITLDIPRGQPQQSDGRSCGVFVCKWAHVLAEATVHGSQPPPFGQADVTKHREAIMCKLLNFRGP